MTDSPLLQSHRALGARLGEVAGATVARDYGDPAAEYRAVRTGAGIADRADLAVVRLHGRDPVKMVQGLITNDLAGAPPGRGVYAAMLTPKGRTITDLRALARTTAEGPEVLLLLAREALEGTREHLKKYVPPMFARWADVTEERAVVGIYGPSARALLSRAIASELPDLPPEGFVEAALGTEPLLVVRTDWTGEDGYDVVLAAQAAPALWDTLLAQGADLGVRPVGQGALHTLRIEAGRPRYGLDLTEQTIPAEAFESAGLLDRAISFTKGCYTGQEVVVRIAHRGHVNRHLRGLLLNDAALPEPGTSLLHPETGKEVGWTASATVSPRVRQTIALGYVRREIAPGQTLSLGTGGETAEVTDLPFG